MDSLKLVLIAVIGGIASAFQGQFMGVIDSRVGSKESVFITYVSGGILAALMMLVARGGHLNLWHRVPWYTLTTGVLGLVVVGAIGFTAPRLGLGKAFTIIVASQLIAAVVFDQFGLFGAAVRVLSVQRLVGLVAMILGVWLILK